MAEHIGDLLERGAAVDHRGGGRVAQRVDTPVDNPGAYENGPHGVANMIVAALGRERRPSRLKHADGMRGVPRI